MVFGWRRPRTRADYQVGQVLDPLFAHVPVDEAAKADLVANINGIERQYHGPSHLVDLWTCHRLHAADAGLDTPRAHRRIACVIAFHDAVYDSQRRDNEERSAKLWLEVATRCQLDPDEAIWVAETIRATSNHLGYRAGDADDPDERLRIWFLDLDLTPLAETPVRFRRNSRRIRRESCHLTDDAWAGREPGVPRQHRRGTTDLPFARAVRRLRGARAEEHRDSHRSARPGVIASILEPEPSAQSVLRYSSSARLSAPERRVPNSWPQLLFPDARSAQPVVVKRKLSPG